MYIYVYVHDLERSAARAATTPKAAHGANVEVTPIEGRCQGNATPTQQAVSGSGSGSGCGSGSVSQGRSHWAGSAACAGRPLNGRAAYSKWPSNLG